MESIDDVTSKRWLHIQIHTRIATLFFNYLIYENDSLSQKYVAESIHSDHSFKLN